jgi:hypothetical protein
MTSFSHIIIGAVLSAIFSTYTIVNICTYVTEQHNLLVNSMEKLSDKVNMLTVEKNTIIFADEKLDSTFEMDNIYEIDTNFEFTSEQLRLLLGTNDKDKANECDHNSDSSGDIVTTNDVETNDDDIVEANNVVEANDDDVVDLPELIDLDDEKDTKRVTDNLLVIARKALLGV